jgi:large subunit ribosomal protein L4
MPTLDVINQDKKKVGTVSLSDEVFAASVNVPLVHQVIKAQLAGRRQGTAKTKTKGEVRGGGRKPFRQKGTGNARQGSSRSPLHPGGGQSFGPQPRSYEQATPKEMVRGALRSAISDRLKAERLLIVDEFKLAEIKTKAFAGVLAKGLQLDKALIVDSGNRNLELSCRNIPHVKVLRTEGINVYDIVRYPWLVMTKGAAEAVDARLSGKGAAAVAAPRAEKKAATKAKAAPKAKTTKKAE